MTDAPWSIRWFETLLILSVMIGLLNEFAVIHDDYFRTIVSAVIVLAFTFLVSRGRKSWPRWVFFGMLVLGLAWMIWSAPTLLPYGYLPSAIGLVANLMQVVAVILSFTPESAKWVRTSPARLGPLSTHCGHWRLRSAFDPKLTLGAAEELSVSEA